MKIPRVIFRFSSVTVVTLVVACGGQTAPTEIPADAEPVVVEWDIGPKGGLGEGSAMITQRTWEPKKLEVPVNQPFIIRFVPRDTSTDTIVFSNSLKTEVGIDLENLVVENGESADTPVMIIQSGGRTFDVFSREHRGTGGFGAIITPAS